MANPGLAARVPIANRHFWPETKGPGDAEAPK